MKRFLTAFVIVLAVLLSLLLHQIYKPDNVPTSDLASPSQEKRDAAAKMLRVTAKPSSKFKWVLRTAFIRAGETQTNIFDFLRAYNLSTQPEAGMGGLGAYYEYRLDDYWLLGCEFNNIDYKNLILEKWKLIPRWRDIFFLPSTNFSGVWITYYANGQKSSEGNYKDGNRSGEFIDFYLDGSRSSVWHYENGKRNGLWTQYFPSGRIQIQCLLSNYLKIGDMVWYYENGLKQSITHYDNGEKNGPSTVYFPSGKIESQCQYSNYTKVGLEVKYNEDGTTNSVKDYSKP
jgi:hypothetical protein